MRTTGWPRFASVLALSRAAVSPAASAQEITGAGTARPDRMVLPVPGAPFTGTIAPNVLDAWPAPVRAPAGAPNVP